MKITAVIVTYNRKELLVRNISSLATQSIKIDHIIIVNNNSTDGTEEYLKSQKVYNDKWIEIINLPENTGGAGGFSFGVMYAYNSGFDYIWLMDDDGRAANENTFRELILFAQYAYNNLERKIFINSYVTYDGMQPSFGDFHGNQLVVNIRGKKYYYIENQANPFNGTLISREVVETVGVPNKDFFIINDEMDYFYRCQHKGVYIATCFNSVYIHPKQKIIQRKFLCWHLVVFNFTPFKLYYDIRNKVYYLKCAQEYSKLRRELLNRFLSILMYENEKLRKVFIFFKAVHDGWRGLLGKRV